MADRHSQPGNGGGRLDRWLWFARVIKSRTLAAGLIEDGRVRLNRQKVTKPSQSVRPGDVLTITVGPRVRIFKVVALGVRRGPAPEARLLYEDLSPPMEKPDPASMPDAERERGSGRPTKRDRRMLDRFKGEDA